MRIVTSVAPTRAPLAVSFEDKAMRWLGCLFVLVLTSASALAQESQSRFPSNRNFPNFIGFMSNPVQSLDPRALTQIVPMFSSAWVSSYPALPEGDFQIYGPAVNVALSDRFSIGLNQGGYLDVHTQNQLQGPRGRERNVQRDREGWANFGGFAQYTLIEDVPNQFLLTAGMRLEVPLGSESVFQGTGPPYMAVYGTGGKEFGNFHVLATAGYEFPLGTDRVTTQTLYTNFHLDYRLTPVLYPVFEINAAYRLNEFNLGDIGGRGFGAFSNFEASGTTVSYAAGLNAVLIQDKLEMGAVYQGPLYTAGPLDFDVLLVKFVLRF